MIPISLYFCPAEAKLRAVKRLLGITVGVFLLGAAVFPARAQFTSFWIFGDGISTTTNNPGAGSGYYGLRRSNGRVWVEVLAEWQGVIYESNQNWSYYGDDSSALVTHVNNFISPADSNTALYAVWVANADFVDDMGNIFPDTTTPPWSNAIRLSLTNHWKAITNLYAKGARAMVLPNAVDISIIPAFNTESTPSQKTFIRQQVINFNSGFSNMLGQIGTLYPDLTIYAPDAFSLQDNILAHPASYGVSNVLSGGEPISATGAFANTNLNGPGAYYVFWDDTDPTAIIHMHLADIAQQLISPAQINKITALKGSNQLDVVNVPIGRDGTVDFTTSLSVPNWAAVTNVDTNFATQTIFITPTSPDTAEYYRLHFPFAWTWP